MRNGLIGLASAMVLASTLAAAGCSGSSGSGADGGGGSSSGGSGGGNSGGGGSGGGGSSGVDGGGSSVTSISGSKPLNALTPAEADQLCGDTGSYFARSISKSDSCKFTALSFAAVSSAPTEAELRTGCSATQSDCNQADASSTGTSTPCNPIPSTCTATVAQYSACINDETVRFEQVVSTLPSCSTLTRADIDAINMATAGVNQTASCMALATACPDLGPPFPN